MQQQVKYQIRYTFYEVVYKVYSTISLFAMCLKLHSLETFEHVGVIFPVVKFQCNKKYRVFIAWIFRYRLQVYNSCLFTVLEKCIQLNKDYLPNTFIFTINMN